MFFMLFVFFGNFAMARNYLEDLENLGLVLLRQAGRG
jgi:hypothetical protein